MSLFAYDYKIRFIDVDCCKCHGIFMMTEEAVTRLQQTKKDFHCPYCGTEQGWYGDNKEDKLRKKLEKQLEIEKRSRKFAQQQAEKALKKEQTANNKLRATKGVVTRIKNRVKNGVCPCCNRHFKNLHRHMQNQHPDFVKKGKKK